MAYNFAKNQERREIAQEQYAAGANESLLSLQSYLYNYKGVSKVPSVLPFYIQVVDQEGRPKRLPFPPQTDNNPSNQAKLQKTILGIKFLINPASVSVNMAKIINRTPTMTGWIEDHWGEELDTITLQGSSAAFVIGSNTLRNARKLYVESKEDREAARSDFYSYLDLDDLSVKTPVTTRSLEIEPGLTVRKRRDTISYRQFKSLVQLFATNGCLFDSQGFVSERNFIRMSYDYSSYMGYFESIDITEDANSPFKFVYNVTFKAEKTEYNFVTRRMPKRKKPGIEPVERMSSFNSFV